MVAYLEHIGQCFRVSAFTKPVVIFLISLMGPAIVLSLPFVLAWQSDHLASHLYLFGTLGQTFMDLPALIMLAHDKVDWLGRNQDYVPSIGIEIVGAILLAADSRRGDASLGILASKNRIRLGAGSASMWKKVLQRRGLLTIHCTLF